MLRKFFWGALCAGGIWLAAETREAQAQHAYQRLWGNAPTSADWQRMYHYPYVFYPQNFYSSEYFQSARNMYYRYPPEMRIPVYNKKWHNAYPEPRRYYHGHHFNLDVF